MLTLDSPELKNISPQKLGELLIEAKKAYYTGGKPIMDDHTYDVLEDTLRRQNPHHRIFSKVGTDNFNTGFDKKSHSMPMGSQNKVNTYSDLIRYFQLKKISETTEFIVQVKCDGISLEIEYQNGQLVDAITRGDGRVGDIITQNVVLMKNFVTRLPQNFSGSVRCEIVMLDSDFKKLNQIVQNDNETYSNSRNAASGISQRLDGQFSEYCSLYAVDIYSNSPSTTFDTESDKISLLKQYGFATVDTFVCRNFDEVETIYQKFLNTTRLTYPFEIDGLVIKINDLILQHQLGSKNNRPKGQVAYKFPSRSSQTRIIDVDWQVGPMGTITPVAKVDPIEISGAVITFASLANYNLIKDKNINLDDIVEIQRRGDVIPHIEKVVTKITPGHIKPPQKCPSCHTALIKDSKFLRCPNLANCRSQILGSLKLFCDNLDIKGISHKTITKLYDLNLVRLPGDFYHLTVTDFEVIPGLGQKSGNNIVRQIQSKNNLTLKQILNAAIIPNFSAQRINQIIAAGFDTPQKILNLTVSQLEALPGIKITLAEKIYQGIQSRRDFIQSILSQVKLKTSTHHHQSDISGLSFAITGTLSVPRKKLEENITSLGGKIANSVTSKTDYLITNDINSNSDKFTSAKKLGTKIISEAEFSKLAD